jgi:hypothetical protein
MKLIDSKDADSNWSETLDLWNRVVNWDHYLASESQLRSQIKTLLVYIWNEKDWLKSQYQSKSREIETYISNSKYICVVADLANTVKHRNLTKTPRSPASQTGYYGSVTVGRDAKRHLYFINMGNGEHFEIFQIINGALDEFEDLQMSLLSDTV